MKSKKEWKDEIISIIIGLLCGYVCFLFLNNIGIGSAALSYKGARYIILASFAVGMFGSSFVLKLRRNKSAGNDNETESDK